MHAVQIENSWFFLFSVHVQAWLLVFSISVVYRRWDPASAKALLLITSMDDVEFGHVKPIVLRLMQIWQAAYPVGGPVVLLYSLLD